MNDPRPKVGNEPLPSGLRQMEKRSDQEKFSFEMKSADQIRKEECERTVNLLMKWNRGGVVAVDLLFEAMGWKWEYHPETGYTLP